MGETPTRKATAKVTDTTVAASLWPGDAAAGDVLHPDTMAMVLHTGSKADVADIVGLITATNPTASVSVQDGVITHVLELHTDGEAAAA